MRVVDHGDQRDPAQNVADERWDYVPADYVVPGCHTAACQVKNLDGSRHDVYKRYFTAEGLAAELGGGDTLHAGRWFVAVRARV